MVELFLRLIINATLLMFVSRLVLGLYVEGWGAAFVGAIVLGLVNFFVKPVMVVLTFPFPILTFGLFLLLDKIHNKFGSKAILRGCVGEIE